MVVLRAETEGYVQNRGQAYLNFVERTGDTKKLVSVLYGQDGLSYISTIYSSVTS